MEQKQVTITAITRKQRTSRSGKPFISLGLKTQEYGEQWLSGFAGKENAHWKEGDVVEVIIEKKGEYLNFSLPTRTIEKKSENSELARLINMMELSVLPSLKYLVDQEKKRPENFPIPDFD